MSSNTGENDDRDQLCGGGGGHGSISGEIISSKNECTSCEQNNVDNIIEDVNSMAILSDISICASCGREGNSDDMNTCNKCSMQKETPIKAQESM